MADHSVSLPAVGFPAAVRAAIATLAFAGSFADPARRGAAQLEAELLTRFAGHSSLDVASIVAWLESAGMAYQDLGALVAQLQAGTITPLHTALQQQIDAGGVVLVQVARVEQVAEATSNTALHPGQSGPHWLLRSGYSDDSDYGLYYDLSADGPQPVRIVWKSIIDAGISAAIALNAPKPPLDLATISDALHIAQQGVQASYETAMQALANVKAAHGL
jgi:hypothetical protein